MKLNEWLVEQKLTQGQLARKLGLSRQLVNRVAQGNPPGEVFLWHFYRVFGQEEIIKVFGLEDEQDE